MTRCPVTSQHVTLRITIDKFTIGSDIFSVQKSTRLIALVTMRLAVMANTWRTHEGMMGDRRISRKRKGNVLSSCVAPVYMNALQTMTLTGKQRDKVQVRELQPGEINRGS